MLAHTLDDVLPELDVVYMLRIQQERLESAAVTPCAARVQRCSTASTAQRNGARCGTTAIVMHPGPHQPWRRAGFA